MGDLAYSPIGDLFDVGKYGDEDNKKTDMAKNIAASLYLQTDPARQKIIDRGTSFLEGDLDPRESPMYGPMKQATESSYNQARENILGNMPSGGGMASALAENEFSRAGNLSRAAGNIASDEYSKIYGFATGAPQTSLSGLTSLAGIDAQKNMANNQAKWNAAGGMGTGLGLLLGK
jgi:hypothetical protein